MNSASVSTGRTLETPRTRRTFLGDGQVTVHRLSSHKTPPPSAAPGASALAHVAVSEVMPSNVVCVGPDLSVEALHTLFIEQGISGVPVVNERGLPIGMVSKTDIVRHRYENGGTQAEAASAPRESADGLHVETLAEATVGELMVPLAFTLLESAPLSHAAALMAWEGVHRIPVCSDAGDVVGIVTALDVVRWLARQEGYPARKLTPVPE